MKTYLAICLICLPLKNLHVNSAYGYRQHPLTGKIALHKGVDLQARSDTVYAILQGVVLATGYDQSLGIYVRLGHGNLTSVYGHLRRVFLGPHTKVDAGTPLGITGATGRVTGEHLHFGVTYQGHDIDPIKFLYELLIKKENEQKFQTTSRATFR